jgi:hypothetical protein
MPDESNRNKSSVAENITAPVTIVLAILGLAHVAPEYLVAISTVVFGAALLLHGSATLADYASVMFQPGAAPSPVAAVGDSGLSAVFFGRRGRRRSRYPRSSWDQHGRADGNRRHRLWHCFDLKQQFGRPRPFVAAVTRDARRKSPARRQRSFGRRNALELSRYSRLGGLGAIVLGILALAGFSPVVLILIAPLALGSVSALNGIDFTAAVLSARRGS